MTATEEVPVSGERGVARWWPTLAVLGGLWLFAINQLRLEWSINPQYTYGWTVPFLALYLGLERWKDRPSPEAPAGRGFLFAALPLVLALLPIRLIQESAPDWRLIGWAVGGACVAISFVALYSFGGRPWLRHFWFPVAFFLVAVAWPAPFENSMIQWLMRTVTTLCVEALSWFGIPALQDGNVIQISAGRVGVEEACSGVRSLQTTLMIALFMGELMRFGWIRRIILLVGGLGVAFVCNSARAFFLVWISVQSGTTSAVAKWHDNIGMAVLVSSLVGVGILCVILKGKKATQPEVPADALQPGPGRPLMRAVVIGLAVWLVGIEIATEAWYRIHESKVQKVRPWSVRFPEEKPGFRTAEFSEITQSILRYTEGRAAGWSDGTGPGSAKWEMFFLRWEPGRTSSQLARSHGPEICLAASGATVSEDLGVKVMRFQGVSLPMHAYIFKTRKGYKHVFYCLWEQGDSDDPAPSTAQDLTVASRLKAVRAGRRNAGQQVIEIAISDIPSAAEAELAVTQFLENAIRL